MIVLNFEKWFSACDNKKIYERIYIVGKIWTPFVKVKDNA